MREQAARRAEREIASLVHDGVGWLEFARGANRALQRAVPFDAACWHPLDPSTLLLTGYFSQNLPDEPALPYHEYAIADVNQWATMARRRQPVGLLSAATRGQVESSPRFRALLEPYGIRHELRMAFTDSGDAWGSGGLYRDPGRADFDDDEIRLVRSLSPLIAEGMRRAMITTVAATPGDLTAHVLAASARAPGVVIFDAKGEVESVTEPAAEMLADLAAQSGLPPDRVPLVVMTVAELARRDGGHDGLQAGARARGRSGRWFALHGSRLAGRDAGRLAVVMEPATPRDTAPLLLLAYRLTAREREVAGHCIAGASTSEIAAKLHITPHTVQDHLKAVFEKVGVRSRRELVSRVFNAQVLPRVAAGEAFSPTRGWVAGDEPASVREG